MVRWWRSTTVWRSMVWLYFKFRIIAGYKESLVDLLVLICPNKHIFAKICMAYWCLCIGYIYIDSYASKLFFFILLWFGNYIPKILTLFSDFGSAGIFSRLVGLWWDVMSEWWIGKKDGAWGLDCGSMIIFYSMTTGCSFWQEAKLEHKISEVLLLKQIEIDRALVHWITKSSIDI